MATVPDPTPRQLAALRGIERAVSSGSGFANQAGADECVESGWLEPVVPRGYRLTAAGRKVLAAAR